MKFQVYQKMTNQVNRLIKSIMKNKKSLETNANLPNIKIKITKLNGTENKNDGSYKIKFNSPSFK